MREPRQKMDRPLDQAKHLLVGVDLNDDSEWAKTLLLEEAQAYALVSIAESLAELVLYQTHPLLAVDEQGNVTKVVDR